MDNSTILSANPQASYLARKDELDAAIKSCLKKGWYILGNEVECFEKEFAGFIGTNEAIGVASGTDALIVALRSCGIGPGDFVITVSHTAVATVAAIDLCGAKPVLIDVDPETCTMNPELLLKTLKAHGTEKVKAVIPVHLYGSSADVAAIVDIAKRFRLRVIEDCAQAHGASVGGNKVGTFGDFGAFSFYPTKNLGAFGDGGGLVTNDLELAKQSRIVRQYGWQERYVSDIPGLNSRLDEIQAAILRVKLRYLNEDNARRRTIAGMYTEAFSGTDLILPRETPDNVHVYHQFVIRSAKRESLRLFLNENSIGTSVLYPVPIHLQRGYRDRVVIGAGGLGWTDRICGEILSLPMYPELSDDQVGRIIETVLTWYNRK